TLSLNRFSALNLEINASTFMNLNLDSGSSKSCLPRSSVQTRILSWSSARSTAQSLFIRFLKPINAFSGRATSICWPAPTANRAADFWNSVAFRSGEYHEETDGSVAASTSLLASAPTMTIRSATYLQTPSISVLASIGRYRSTDLAVVSPLLGSPTYSQ